MIHAVVSSAGGSGREETEGESRAVVRMSFMGVATALVWVTGLSFLLHDPNPRSVRNEGPLVGWVSWLVIHSRQASSPSVRRHDRVGRISGSAWLKGCSTVTCSKLSLWEE